MASISGTGRIRLAEENRWKRIEKEQSEWFLALKQCDTSKNKKGVSRPNTKKSFSDETRPRRWSIFRVMRCRWFIFQQWCDTDYFMEKLNIAIVAIIFLDHREQLFCDYFAHFRTDCDYSVTDWDHQKGSYTRNQMQRDFLTMHYRLKIIKNNRS